MLKKIKFAFSKVPASSLSKFLSKYELEPAKKALIPKPKVISGEIGEKEIELKKTKLKT